MSNIVFAILIVIIVIVMIKLCKDITALENQLIGDHERLRNQLNDFTDETLQSQIKQNTRIIELRGELKKLKPDTHPLGWWIISLSDRPTRYICVQYLGGEHVNHAEGSRIPTADIHKWVHHIGERLDDDQIVQPKF